ncbi:MAG: hypothetical protein HDR90_09810 [Bacteroides sp.]|nr:hypothetical protein [Bacteroides sp.]
MKLFRILFPAFIALVSVFTPVTTAAQEISPQELREQIAKLPTQKVVDIAHRLLETPLAGNKETVKQYSALIIMWLTDTDDMTLSINVSPVLVSNANILSAYMAAEIINTASRGLTQNNEATYIASMNDVLKYYKDNKGAIGNISELDKLSKLKPEKLDKKLSELYAKSQKH